MTLDELEEWSRHQSSKVQATIDEAHREKNREIAAQAVDIAWGYYTRFTRPAMMPTGRTAERKWQGMSDHARRMLVDAACTMAYGRQQRDWR